MPSDQLQRILDLSALVTTFDTLKQADPDNGSEIEASIRNALGPHHAALREDSLSPDRVRYYLLQSAIELKAQASTFLNYEREMAQREAALWRFALGIQEQFFRDIFDALDTYFAEKSKKILQEINDDDHWYANLRDHAKKGGALIKFPAKWFRDALDGIKESQKIGEQAEDALEKASKIADAAASLDIRDAVTRSIQNHLPDKQLANDLESIFKSAASRYERAWADEIRSQTPNLRDLQRFAGRSLGAPNLPTGLDVGLAEQTLAAGVGGALVGTFSLAAGWHALAYSMINVFAPVAVAAIIATIWVAVWNREKDLEKRQAKIIDSVNTYHRHCILELDTHKHEELEGKTLREALGQKSKEVVDSTLSQWQISIGGRLTGEDFRSLGSACTDHLQLIQECMDDLSGDASGDREKPK